VANGESSAPGPKQQVYRRTLEATREAIAEVRDNMRAVREARDRNQSRVEQLQKDLAAARQLTAAQSAREERLERAIKRLRTDRFRSASELAHVTELNTRLEHQLQEITARCNSLAEKATDLQLVVKQKADLQRRLSEIRSASVAKDRMIADLEKHLRQARAVIEKTQRNEERRASQDKEQVASLQEEAAVLTRENAHLKKAAASAQSMADELRKQMSAERELRETLQFDLDLSRRSIREMKHVLGDTIESGQSALKEFEEALGGPITPD
jgi:chromosome segregation ATPase